MSEPSVTYVLAVHNQVAELRKTVGLLVERLAHLSGSEIILVENGSTDGSGPLCLALAASFASEAVGVRVTTSAKGHGLRMAPGYGARSRRDIRPHRRRPAVWLHRSRRVPRPEPSTFIGDGVEDASGFADRDAGGRGVRCRPGSDCCAAGLIGLNIDTQGSVIISRSLAQALLPRLHAGDYLIGAEINLWAVHEGVTPVEVPVVYTASGRSTVSPVRDSVSMAKGLLSLRRRLADEQRPIRHAGEVAPS